MSEPAPPSFISSSDGTENKPFQNTLPGDSTRGSPNNITEAQVAEEDPPEDEFTIQTSGRQHPADSRRWSPNRSGEAQIDLDFETVDRLLQANRQQLYYTTEQVNQLEEELSQIETTQSELSRRLADVTNTNNSIEELSENLDTVQRTVAEVETEFNSFRSDIAGRVRELEAYIEDMGQPAGSNSGVNPPYPSFASFSLRAAVTSILFIALFWTFYTQGTIGGVLFGALLAFLAVVGVASATTWYKLK
ncbi:hypothetical protein [Halorubrum distributum]|uniref:hypothetical protein n=1 Tax=Halorubrum distributum TaxID=29283 RepID=UPI001269214B|nr:hypothetical protein [Halorubrum arcis]